MAVIKSGASADELTVDATSKAARTTLYSAAGTEIGTASNPIIASANQNLLLTGSAGAWTAASWRIVGVAATSQVLATVRNNGGARKIYIRRFAVDVSHTAAAVDLVAAYFRLWGNTGVTPSGGSGPTKHPLNVSYGSSQGATEILFAASADGVAAAITHAMPAPTPWREQAKANVMTAAGLAGNHFDYELVRFDQHPFVVSSGETAALMLVGNAVDVVTRHYTVKIVWEEI